MPILYKLLTALLALTGCASLAITGEVSPIMSLSAVALVPGYYRFFRGEKHAPTAVIGILAVLELFIFLFDAVAVSGDVFIAVAHLTIAFQALKSFDLKEPWDHLQVYFVSLLQLIIASELTTSLAFGVVFVIFMVMLVTAMVFSHFLKEGQIDKTLVSRPVYVISVLTLCITTIFFIALPRLTHRFIGKSHTRGIHTSGFSEQMDFGDLGSVKLDPTVIMRVEMDAGAGGPLYWRGRTLEVFDGIRWKNDLRTKNRIQKTGDEFLLGPYNRGQVIEQLIDLEPLDSDVIFGLSLIRGIKTDAYFLTVDAAGNLAQPGKASRRSRYTVYSDISKEEKGTPQTIYLQVPSGIERISELARDITRPSQTPKRAPHKNDAQRDDQRGAQSGDQTDAQKARAIAEYLGSNYAYSLTISPPPKGISPLEDFLFRSKRGYCEHYSSAMVLMLRSVGVHARIVTGFIGGDRNAYGGYLIVRQSDAHSWVEALINGKWKRFDPTPSVAPAAVEPYSLFWDSVKMKWARYVVGFRPSDQRAIFGHLTRQFSTAFGLLRPDELSVKGVYTVRYSVLLMIVALILLLTMLSITWKRRQRKRSRASSWAITASYLKVRKALRRRGIRMTPSTTPAGIMEQTGHYSFSARLSDYLSDYNRIRFGNKGVDEALLNQEQELLREIERKQKKDAGK